MIRQLQPTAIINNRGYDDGDLQPSNHVEHKPCLRLRELPVNEFGNGVLVVKLEFDKGVLPGA